MSLSWNKRHDSALRFSMNMIAVEIGRLRSSKIRLRLILIALLLTSACTNNSFALKILYNQFDTLMKRELLSYADFNDEQERVIKNEVDHSLTWHRRTELPRLADSLRSVQLRLLNETPQQQDVEWLFEELRSAGQRFEARSPLVALAPMMKTLSPQQVEQIKQKVEAELAEEQQELLTTKKKESAQSSAKEFAKFLSRFGLEVTNEQRNRMAESFAKRKISRQMRHDLDRQWSTEFLGLLTMRQSSDFVTQFQAHHFARSSLTERTYPELYEHDNALFVDMLLQLFSSLSQAQKDEMTAQTTAYIVLADELATQESS